MGPHSNKGNTKVTRTRNSVVKNTMSKKQLDEARARDAAETMFPTNCTMCQKISQTAVASVEPGTYATSGVNQTFPGSVTYNGTTLEAVHINFEPSSIIRCPGKPDTYSGMFFHVYIIKDNIIPGGNVYNFNNEPGRSYLHLFEQILGRNLNSSTPTNIDTIYEMMNTGQINRLFFIILNQPNALDNNITITNLSQLGTIENLASCKESNGGGSRKKKSIRRRKKTYRRRC
jgi:hypothetical protein